MSSRRSAPMPPRTLRSHMLLLATAPPRTCARSHRFWRAFVAFGHTFNMYARRTGAVRKSSVCLQTSDPRRRIERVTYLPRHPGTSIAHGICVLNLSLQTGLRSQNPQPGPDVAGGRSQVTIHLYSRRLRACTTAGPPPGLCCGTTL
ncbi:hypothetical protein BV25DRAFT_1378657 [Artomyces pyxidatus]|uniref:Uncharacterized protein n=1 Tax=Artomyces pyxidatus TaxID=48021 RepID=A0ACB8TDB7_9AGAM|nr:hypothetical protein BV25DRAFT_1378657 [Artomyces pyxidatus]